MLWLKVTSVRSGAYNGELWIDFDRLVAMRRVHDRRGDFTVLIPAVAETAIDENTIAAGFAGFDVAETPEQIISRVETFRDAITR